MKWFKKRDEQVEVGKWYVGWKDKHFEIGYRTSGYHYNNAEIHISMFGWQQFITASYSSSLPGIFLASHFF